MHARGGVPRDAHARNGTHHSEKKTRWPRRNDPAMCRNGPRGDQSTLPPTLSRRGRRNGYGYEYQSEWALRHRAEGRAEGEAEGKAEILLKLLTLKFGGVSAEQLAQVQSSSVDELERYAERVITVDMLDEVLASRAREERREGWGSSTEQRGVPSDHEKVVGRMTL